MYNTSFWTHHIADCTFSCKPSFTPCTNSCDYHGMNQSCSFFAYNVAVALIKRTTSLVKYCCSGGSRISGKGVRKYKGVSFALLNFLIIFLIYPMIMK